ncbi:MAG TPA: YebC/PmpR family DNA-binding transcriptional regulator [Longimicrobiaceae bacterium]|nr:YebC/PmpR family DNA-binding transcriptional regulator [Longimicrobiaceae bacterium]
MSGHSKWSSIKRKKAVTDSRRAATWTKLIRELTVAAKAGGGDPLGNPRLRLAIDTARTANMPNDNIERAIKKGTGELEGVEYQEMTYEAYGPGGVAIFIEALTDNLNRTVADLRHMLSKNGGNLGQSGSVAWMFDHKGQIIFDASRYDEATILEAALEAGAEDMEAEDGSLTVYSEVTDFHAVQDALKATGLEWEDAGLAMVPKTMIKVEGKDAERLVKLLDLLEESDDVQNVFSNADIDYESLVSA